MMKRSMQVVACVFGLVACSAAPPAITIGAILSETGMLATVGEDHLFAIRMAIDEINAAGGIRGSTLALVNEDDRSSAAGAVTAATTLIARDHVPAIIGAINSDATLAIIQK